MVAGKVEDVLWLIHASTPCYVKEKMKIYFKFVVIIPILNKYTQKDLLSDAAVETVQQRNNTLHYTV